MSSMQDPSDNSVELMGRLQNLYMRMFMALSKNKSSNPQLEAPGLDLYQTAATAWAETMKTNAEKLLEPQAKYWQATHDNWMRAQGAFMSAFMPSDQAMPEKE